MTTTATTVTAAFAATVARRPDAPALRWRGRDGTWHTASWDDYREQAARVGAGLRRLGVTRGERVVLLLRNRPEFHFADMGALLCGAVPISIYNSTPAEPLGHLLAHCGARVAIADDSELLERLMLASANRAELQHLVVVDDREGIAPAGVLAFDDLTAAPPLDLDGAAASTSPDDLATVIYTSGTTGPPKGVLVTHRNVLSTAEALRRAVDRDVDRLAAKRVVSYLPMAHIAERMISHYEAVECGFEVTTCPEVGLIARYLPEVRPHIAFGVPRVWERVHSQITTLAPEADAARVRQLVGLDHAEFVFTGSAPTSPALIEWFRSVGIPMAEIYGLSETTGAVATETERPKPGWAGRPLPGVEVRLADDGEILVRGPNVVPGYLDDPVATEAAIDPDGWFSTGDVGEIDGEGYLRVVDRKKELIVTGGGKKISPANLESALRDLPLVSQAVVVGEGRPYLVALVVLDPDAASPQGDGAIDDELARGIEALNAVVSPPERIHRWAIVLGNWTADSAELTPTMKLKRREVEAKYAAQIEALYHRT